MYKIKYLFYSLDPLTNKTLTADLNNFSVRFSQTILFFQIKIAIINILISPYC